MAAIERSLNLSKQFVVRYIIIINLNNCKKLILLFSASAYFESGQRGQENHQGLSRESPHWTEEEGVHRVGIRQRMLLGLSPPMLGTWGLLLGSSPSSLGSTKWELPMGCMCIRLTLFPWPTLLVDTLFMLSSTKSTKFSWRVFSSSEIA